MKKSVINSTALFACAFFALSTMSCSGKDGKKASETEQENVYAVNASIAREGNLDDYLEFGGDVSSLNAVDVYPDVAGKISRIVVSVGDYVRKNQVIAYVDASRPGMNYAANPVKAPISGTVTSIGPTLGTMVSQSYSIAKISDTDELQVKINVAERFISRIENGQGAVVSFDAYPGVEFNAKVFEVSPVLDTTSRTMLVKLKVTPSDPRIRAGMFAKVRLITESIKNAVVLSTDAIIRRDGKPYVFTVSRNTAGSDEKDSVSMVSVSEGLTVDNKTEICEGLKEGDIVVVKGQSLLTDGAKVKILSIDGKNVESEKKADEIKE